MGDGGFAAADIAKDPCFLRKKGSSHLQDDGRLFGRIGDSTYAESRWGITENPKDPTGSGPDRCDFTHFCRFGVLREFSWWDHIWGQATSL
jgi:hypothetical protein